MGARERDARERFAALYAAHLKQILGFAARRCDAADDAADVASEVFMTAWRRLDELPPGDETRLWLYGVARRVLANHRRGSTRRDRLGQALKDAWSDAASSDRSVINPADVAVIRDDVAAVRRALAQLRRSDAELLTLVAWEGLTSAEAAVVLSIKSATARARLSRARARLRQLLGQPESTGQGRDKHVNGEPGPAEPQPTLIDMEARS